MSASLLSYPVLRLGDGLEVCLADYRDTGLRIGVWASSGRGKTNTVGVLIEEFLEAGFPAVILDPEGEFWTLKEAYRALVVGGPQADLPATANREAVKEILSTSLDERLALIFDFSEESTNAGQQRLALPVLEELFSLATRKRQPILLAVEEVQVFLPTAKTRGRLSGLLSFRHTSFSCASRGFSPIFLGTGSACGKYITFPGKLRPNEFPGRLLPSLMRQVDELRLANLVDLVPSLVSLPLPPLKTPASASCYKCSTVPLAPIAS